MARFYVSSLAREICIYPFSSVTNRGSQCRRVSRRIESREEDEDNRGSGGKNGETERNPLTNPAATSADCFQSFQSPATERRKRRQRPVGSFTVGSWGRSFRVYVPSGRHMAGIRKGRSARLRQLSNHVTGSGATRLQNAEIKFQPPRWRLDLTGNDIRFAKRFGDLSRVAPLDNCVYFILLSALSIRTLLGNC